MISFIKEISKIYNESIYTKTFIRIYVLATIILTSYGTYCMVLKEYENGCWIIFVIGILLLMFAVMNLIFLFIAHCLEIN
jgi:hypothetical protein